MPLDPVQTASWPFPPTPCDEGSQYSPIITCNGMGEWIPDWILADEGGGFAAERIKSAAPLKCGGCKVTNLDAVKYGAELYKQAFEDGFALARTLFNK